MQWFTKTAGRARVSSHHQHLWVRRVLRQNVLETFQLGKKGKGYQVEIESFSPGRVKPKQIGLPVSKTYWLGLLENKADCPWSPP